MIPPSPNRSEPTCGITAPILMFMGRCIRSRSSSPSAPELKPPPLKLHPPPKKVIEGSVKLAPPLLRSVEEATAASHEAPPNQLQLPLPHGSDADPAQEDTGKQPSTVRFREPSSTEVNTPPNTPARGRNEPTLRESAEAQAQPQQGSHKSSGGVSGHSACESVAAKPTTAMAFGSEGYLRKRRQRAARGEATVRQLEHQQGQFDSL